MEVVFKTQNIRYKRTATTENKSKPDFLLPGQEEYYDPAFNPLLLTMLAVKSTCKDRWRQVLARSEEHTSELQSLMRNSYAVFCLKKKTIHFLNKKTKHNVD